MSRMLLRMILTWMVDVMVGTMEVGVGLVTRLVTCPGLTGTLGTEGRGEATVLGINMITHTDEDEGLLWFQRPSNPSLLCFVLLCVYWLSLYHNTTTDTGL